MTKSTLETGDAAVRGGRGDREVSRVCSHIGCQTVLSRYNYDRMCSLHGALERGDGLAVHAVASGPTNESGLAPKDISGLGIRSTSVAIVRDVVTALEERGEWKASSAVLCQIAGVSERSLQIAFSEVFEEPPSVHLRRRALEHVRRVLQLSDAATTSVSEVALDHGFAHLSRFAQYYRNLFGEAPSKTLRRDPHPIQLAS